MMLRSPVVLAALAATLVSAPSEAQQFPLTDAKGFTVKDVTLEPIQVFGRQGIRMTTDKDKEDGLAFVPGVDFQDGTIDVDVALKPTTPPGVRMPGFIGVAFRARTDGSAYDMFYIRPGNSRAEDQSMRNHVVQYVSAPGYGWSELRQSWPWVYESYATIDPNAWTHLTIEVAGRGAKLFLNRSSEPALIVDGLKGQDLHGAVALWGYTAEEAYFSNLRITKATPRPTSNGSDAAGAWQLTLATDKGMIPGTLQLHREGNVLTGMCSGPLGKDLPVTGTWRDGYVELAFTGEWPQDPNAPPSSRPAPKSDPARTTIAGWFDGNSGSGRSRIDGHADGRWTATRVP
jgi:hypothetical protein